MSGAGLSGGLSGLDRLLVTGVTGQLGRAVLALHGAHRSIAASREVLPLDFPETIPHRLDYLRPRAIINCAAYTQVDAAEKAEEEIFVRAINVESPSRIASWCAAHGVPMVHFSTDYVFDGSGDSPRDESSATRPLNAYGRSKLEGERAVLESGAPALIFRTSWVYDSGGRSFFNTILNRASEGAELRVVSDQIGAPTYAPHLAMAALDALERAMEIEARTGRFPTGIYHLTGSGETSWHGFASKIIEGARARGQKVLMDPTGRPGSITPIPSSQYPTPARRPLNSRLNCSRAFEVLGVSLPRWEHGLEECLDLKFGDGRTGEMRK